MNGGLWHGNPVRAYARALDIGTKAAAHNMLAHVARANAELENATRGLKAQLGPELDAAPEARKILNAQRRALDALGLEADAKRADIKTRFKVLVKRHHPDANGGDRGSEDRLRDIIQAYNYLKSAGLC